MTAEAGHQASLLGIARVELHLFWRYPKLLLAAAAVVLIPALYVLIYLTSVWDPSARTGDLPVALVNLDQGFVYRQQAFNVGHDVVARLASKPTFGYVEVASEQEARRLVRQGAMAFALIVPADFSSNAVPGAKAGAGKLVVFTSEGNSYPSAALARRFADDLGREVNQRLNEQRWELVLADADGSQRSIQQLHDGLLRLQQGATDLATGAAQAAHGSETLAAGAARSEQGVAQLASGAKELGTGLRTMLEKRPRYSDLRRLDEGAQALVAGQEELGKGLVQLQQGAQRLQLGVTGFRDETADSLFVSTRVTDGLNQIGDGVGSLESGLKTANTAHQKLADGSVQLSNGVNTLTNGVRAMNEGLRSVVRQLPEDTRLDELVRGSASLSSGAHALKAGTQQLAQGAQHVAGGLALLEGSLPVSIRKMEGNAQGLATSVRPAIEVDAPVQNNGSGFAPNIIPGALWLGANLAVFLIQLRLLPLFATGLSPVARLVGKMLMPAGLVLLQALLVWVAMVWVLHIEVHDVLALALTVGVASLTFLAIVFALTRALGDAGKALALVFLAVQLSSSGGVLPVELSGGLFALISPYMPITWVVKALKASLFGAFEANWVQPLLWVALAGGLALLSACFIGRWRYVKLLAMRPSLDL
ncbi:YhgE/Pip domain-containing protein [Rhodoferax sp. BLA1]|uniref:YhgE/Pip domain-containing protein n=1 Tax=Rhodoferax sp. BLA1 TaxID=2576062 RepID=UPI0015D1D146|nr:YhgE/Pip domain-containing protein [Rhodoferax sp. BLA1]